MLVRNGYGFSLVVLKSFILLTLIGCASSAVLAKPLIVNADDVKTCQLVGDIDVDSGYGKNHNWRSIVHNTALDKAASLSATHLVLVKTQPIGAFNGVLFAKAYRCHS